MKKKKQAKNFKSKKPSGNTRSYNEKATDLKIDKVVANLKGKSFNLSGIVDRIIQTAGPTVFYLNDGTGTLALKAFEGGGTRAYPDVLEGDAISATVKIEEFRDELEGSISKLEKATGKEEQEVKDEIKNIQRERATPEIPNFLIKSPILEKLKDRFTKAATEIRLAITQNRPIIVRHHNDADGYSSGYALERAIIPLIEKQHGPGKAAWEFYTRAPCQAPFYEVEDSIKDSAKSLSNAAKFSNKMPLVIIADNGSSHQDLLAIKQGKVHGMEFIVVDHHVFDEDVISPEVLVHITPFLVDEDGAAFSAGMLCTELARFINNIENIEQIAAMAGIADRIDLKNPKSVNDYIKLAEKQGYSKELLSDMATVLDFVSAKLRFMEAREYIEVIFGHPRDKQKDLVAIMAPYIRGLEAKGLEMAKSSAQTEKIGKTTLQTIDITTSFPGFGFYPKPGMCVGLLHDNLQKEKKLTNVVTAGIMPTAITLRATDESDFSVHELMDKIKKEIPTAFVEGGGHKNAGSINFIPNKQTEVVQLLRNFVNKK